MKILQEFKEFAVKGNMIDLAIGVIIGAAFNKVVDVLVKNVLTPPLGYLTSGTDISDFKFVISEAVLDAQGAVAEKEVAVEYGLLIEAFIDFFIVAMTIFIVVKGINILRRNAEDETNKSVPTPKDIQLLSEIRDQMQKTNALLQKQ